MRLAREGAHVQADFGQDASDREGGQAWRRAQPRDGLAKGRKPLAQLAIKRHNSSLDGIDLTQMDAQQQALMLRQPAMQGLDHWAREARTLARNKPASV